MPRASINYALAATIVASGATLAEAAQKVGAKNANSLAVGLRRKGVTATQARSLEPSETKTKSITLRLASQASELLRKDLGEVLQSHVSKLKEIKPKANLKSLKQLADIAEPLARTAKIVHNWGDETVTGLDMSGLYSEQPVIDVTTTPQEQLEEPSGTPLMVENTQVNQPTNPSILSDSEPTK